MKHFERDPNQFDDLRSKDQFIGASQSKTSVPSSLPDLVSEGSDSYTDVTSRHSCDACTADHAPIERGGVARVVSQLSIH
ncbi:hypothetical protein Y032_0332g2781 [Ancylostoma ceylanicum]|uniref:Uncharacterized protein n=1 Tax=Ancylostoma ceylanicum TaxID=53326 RepID=A0A016S077_9BILA|nr:hypothetical protein Y032_0332g2781 [Ancylostoma ceylanicum]